jgi:hypothetical protein
MHEIGSWHVLDLEWWGKRLGSTIWKVKRGCEKKELHGITDGVSSLSRTFVSIQFLSLVLDFWESSICYLSICGMCLPSCVGPSRLILHLVPLNDILSGLPCRMFRILFV